MTNRANMNGEHPSASHHQPYSHYQHRALSSAASFKGCCCCLFLLLTFLALLLVAVVLVVFLAVKPKKHQFDLQQVGVQYLIVTLSYLSLNITMLFTTVNPNRVGIKYIPSTFFVMYRGVPLGVATIPSFYQSAHSTRTVETRASVNHVDVLQLNAADLIRDATVNDRVELKVTGDVGAKICVMELKSNCCSPLPNPFHHLQVPTKTSQAAFASSQAVSLTCLSSVQSIGSHGHSSIDMGPTRVH